jgi:hypothetical protein
MTTYPLLVPAARPAPRLAALALLAVGLLAMLWLVVSAASSLSAPPAAAPVASWAQPRPGQAAPQVSPRPPVPQADARASASAPTPQAAPLPAPVLPRR